MNNNLIRRMIEGRVVLQISTVFFRLPDGRYMKHVIEEKWAVTRFRRYLFSEEDPGDGTPYRKKDLIQFWSDPGGLRTINAEDIFL